MQRDCEWLLAALAPMLDGSASATAAPSPTAANVRRLFTGVPLRSTRVPSHAEEAAHIDRVAAMFSYPLAGAGRNSAQIGTDGSRIVGPVSRLLVRASRLAHSGHIPSVLRCQ